MPLFLHIPGYLHSITLIKYVKCSYIDSYIITNSVICLILKAYTIIKIRAFLQNEFYSTLLDS